MGLCETCTHTHKHAIDTHTPTQLHRIGRTGMTRGCDAVRAHTHRHTRAGASGPFDIQKQRVKKQGAMCCVMSDVLCV